MVNNIDRFFSVSMMTDDRFRRLLPRSILTLDRTLTNTLTTSTITNSSSTNNSCKPLTPNVRTLCRHHTAITITCMYTEMYMDYALHWGVSSVPYVFTSVIILY